MSCLLHVGAFRAPHDEGDEVVYRTLAREMTWSVSHYTTRDGPVARDFSWTTYRLPLFPHPPLYPLLLKVGDAVGNPVAFSVVFSMLAMGLLLACTFWVLKEARCSPRWAVAGYAGAAFGPLLLYSTARLHTDGLLGVFLACATVATLEATARRPAAGWIALASLLWVVALNLRYNAPLALPLLVGAQAYGLWRRAASAPPGQRAAALRRVASEGESWIAFGVTAALAATLGLQHFYRVLAEYGTLWPWEFIRLDLNAPHLGQLQLYRLSRSRLDVGLALLLVFPLLVIFATPWFWRTLGKDLRAGRTEPFLALAFLYCVSVQLALLFNQLRYFAAATPFLYLCAPYLLRRSRVDGPHRLLLVLAALSLFCMVGTALHSTVSNPEHPGVDPFLSAAADALLGK